ncbi:MAG: hypothetical protein EH225_01970 [Calditrichaeota bacterium]|nr:hypothetical protein [Calditrichota bacterium]RQW07420.1 MAG: hypothetical protein EH225_01970 [Calditrichota bacterium]
MRNLFILPVILMLTLTIILVAQIKPENDPFQIPVVVVKFFPVEGDSIDIEKTGDWGRGLEYTRHKTDSITQRLVEFLEDASRYRAYRNPEAKPSLDYSIVKTFEFLEPLPVKKSVFRKTPFTDYNAIMEKINGKYWIEEESVKEIWLWGYHGGKVHLWESNMAGPYGDVSNSSRDEDDLPVYSSTYTFYHYNYQRGLSEAVEDHMHQIEAVLNYVDGRDDTPKDEWDQLLFWGKFVGSDASHKIIHPGAGWAHYPPNAERDYDWANPTFVESDIEDWKPDGSGRKKKMNCERWNCNSLDWFKLWMQSLPGRDNGLEYQGKSLRNWWIFVGAWDFAMENNFKLVEN